MDLGEKKPLSAETGQGIARREYFDFVLKPRLKDLPDGLPDVLLIPGIGPVEDALAGKAAQRHVVARNPQLRAVSVAAGELLSHNLVEENSLVIPSGKKTAEETQVKISLALRQAVEENQQGELSLYKVDELLNSIRGGKTFDLDRIKDESLRMKVQEAIEKLKQQLPSFFSTRDYLSKPVSEEEIQRVLDTSEAKLILELMAKTAKPSKVEINPNRVFLEESAFNSNANIIETLNYLDEKANEVWDGKLSLLALNSGHLHRLLAAVYAFGLEDKLIPLAVDQVLDHYGYDSEYIVRMKEANQSEDSIRYHAVFVRAIKEIPEFIIPQIVDIKNDERLLQVVRSLSRFYGNEGMKIYGLDSLEEERLNAQKVRNRIANISQTRVKFILERAEEAGKLEELGVAGMDREREFRKIKNKLSQGNIEGDKDDEKAE